MNTLVIQISKFLNRILFFIRYPYVCPRMVLGFFHCSLPALFKCGKGVKLIVTRAPKGHLGILISPGVRLGDDVELNTSGNSKITIQSGSSLQDRCKIIGNVTIYRDNILAPGVYISSGTHQAFFEPYLTIREQDKLVDSSEYASRHINIIEEDCWLGINVFVKPGVCIGRGSVIGANSTITRDVPPYSVVVANNRVIRNRLEFNPGQKIIIDDPKYRPYLYRGFCRSKKFFLPDNLVVFSGGQVSQVKLFFSPAEGEGRIYLNSNKSLGGFGDIKKGDKDCIIPLVATLPLSGVAGFLSNYFCLKINLASGCSPRLEAIEVA